MIPLFKWPGGKRTLARAIASHLNQDSVRLVEPFAGGAALFFHLEPDKALLADTNKELINAYQQIKDNPEKVISALSKYSNDEVSYYAIRESNPRSLSNKAARFYYLMRFSFNGMYRENQQGQFNVPYGHKTHLPVYDENHIMEASRVLGGAHLKCQSYKTTLSHVKLSDSIYCDPPYVSEYRTTFSKYNADQFSWRDQKKLAKIISTLASAGHNIVLSNSDCNSVRNLYTDLNHSIHYKYSSISGTNNGRSHRGELLVWT